MRIISRLTGLFLAITTLASCASISMVDSWHNKAIQKPRMQRALVVSITRKSSDRTVYEDILASELAKRGIAAIPNHTIEPPGAKIDRATLDAAVKKSRADSVFTVQTTKLERQTVVQPTFATTYPGYWYPPAFPDWDLYGYYGALNAYGPTYISTYDIATIQVNLFDTSTGKLTWAATFKSSEPENVVTVAKDLAREVVEALTREGLL